jgi:RHH-type proline utilization regulon transcriptional repressor/proline dehydrogenase/delta 1-pyrroline-5-carboxylate dehydrogenase
VAIGAAAGLALVAHDGGAETVRPLRQALAGRPGGRIPLVAIDQGAERFVLERVVSIDTTASGGNTTLLMLDD